MGFLRKPALFCLLIFGLLLLILAGIWYTGLLPPVHIPPSSFEKPLSTAPEPKDFLPERTGPSKSAAGAPNALENAQTPLRREIEVFYFTKLETIGRYYEGRLNKLISSALSEYNAACRQKQKVSVVSLARKYIPAAVALERDCDGEFYAVLADFKAELQKNYFPLDKAREAQKEYEQAKAARKRQLLSAAAKHL
jgi:hypothetical protein